MLRVFNAQSGALAADIDVPGYGTPIVADGRVHIRHAGVLHVYAPA